MHVPRSDPQVPTSTILRELLLHAPEDRITLGWLMGSLGDRSFGIVLLLLGYSQVSRLRRSWAL
jgi:hypothetical protein